MTFERRIAALVLGACACACHGQSPDGDLDAGDASDASDEPAVDAYVAWCDAGPPELVADEGCDRYLYVPCGVPAELGVDDAGVITRCPPLCPGAPDDVCAELGEPWVDIVFDASAFDAAARTEAGALVLCACTGTGGRRPAGLLPAPLRARSAVGAFFARMAQLEAASVPAFTRLAAELRALGAGRALLGAVERARRDELRHTALVARLAARFGGCASTPRVLRVRHRSALAVARENAVEGCVNETYAALVAGWQARHARDAEVRRVLRAVAADEARHAALAARVARFLDARLDDRGRRVVQRAGALALAALRARAPAPLPADLVRVAGLPPPRAARALVDATESLMAASAHHA